MQVQSAAGRLGGVGIDVYGPVPRQPNPEPDWPTPPGEPDPADGFPGNGQDEQDEDGCRPSECASSAYCAVRRLDINASRSARNNSFGAVGLASRTNSPGAMSAL
jgi:hypothetical protein